MMFGTISESEMRRRTENVGLSVQSVRLEGGDVTRAFMRDAGEYARGASAAPSFFPAPVAVTDWSDDGACLRSLPDSGNERAAEPCGRHGRGCVGGCGERSLLRPCRHSERGSPPAEGTLEQLRRIHRFLFQDVYDWAGRCEPSTWARARGFPSNRWSCSA